MLLPVRILINLSLFVFFPNWVSEGDVFMMVEEIFKTQNGVGRMKRLSYYVNIY